MTAVKLRPDIELKLEQLILRPRSLNSWCPKLLCLVSYLYPFLWLDTNLSKEVISSIMGRSYHMFPDVLPNIKKYTVWSSNVSSCSPAEFWKEATDAFLMFPTLSAWDPMDNIVKVKCTVTSFQILALMSKIFKK